jgi:phospholipase/carboxylesterase
MPTSSRISCTLTTMLETIEVETEIRPTAAVIWLHGLGADGHDFEPIVPEIVRPGERAWRFVFPNAPVRPVTINGGVSMRAWYDLMGLDRQAAEDVAGFRDTDVQIRQLIAKEDERGIPANRIVLAGFSQGGAVSLYTALRFRESLAGVMALSCYLPRESSFSAERAPANDATPIFMGHGKGDTMLPMSLGVQSRDFLKARGYAVEWHDYPMAHAVCAAEIADIREFLFRVLP